MNNLFVIGNGFDRAHKLKTSYLDFKEYIEKNDPQFFEYFYSLHMYSFDRVYENTLMTEPINDEYESLWMSIEDNMKNVNEDLILNTDLELGLEYDDPYSDDSFNTAYDYLASYIKNIPEKLFENLNSWIKSIDIKNTPKKTKYIEDDFEDIFLTFNYTRVLEEVYKIESSEICHIHGEVGDELIMGHLNQRRSTELTEEKNRERDSFFEKIEENSDSMSQEEYEIAMEEFSYRENDFDYKIEQLKYQFLIDYYDETVKAPKIHIQNNQHFFNQVCKVKNIYVVGHSLGEVDMPYFKEILRRVDKDTKWNIFYYRDSERKIFEKKMLEIGIDEKNLVVEHSDLFYINNIKKS
ncbi:MAG: AbiH family protein [Cetobacterium sp.]|uniref:AbiH family protein n=1 Tax=Cetobacterium sp. TaxID=2071632 RepID=UPI003F3E8F63